MTFEEIGLSARLVARLEGLGLSKPTPIQAGAIPHALEGRDVLGIAQTGTGKTAAFGLPLIIALSNREGKLEPRSARGLILAPTRELANQIVESLRGLTSDLRITLVVGGKSINAQAQRLSRGTDILVATPGRLIDLMDRRDVDLRLTKFLVLDEADQMLDIGFVHALRRIARMLNRDRQTMMFSATMPKSISDLAREYLSDPVRVEVSPPGRVADKVSHSVYYIPKPEKQALLVKLLDAHREDRTLVFARTKRAAENLMKHLVSVGFAAASIHGNKSQGQRDRALAAFRSGEMRVLVATDVAARGIDIPDVGYVYNYDLPNVPENYVHRIGRTARAGRSGQAVSFCAADEMSELKAIEKVLGNRIEVADGVPWAKVAKAAKPGSKPGAKPSSKRRPRRRSKKRPNSRIAA